MKKRGQFDEAIAAIGLAGMFCTAREYAIATRTAIRVLRLVDRHLTERVGVGGHGIFPDVATGVEKIMKITGRR